MFVTHCEFSHITSFEAIILKSIVGIELESIEVRFQSKISIKKQSGVTDILNAVDTGRSN